jgi:4-diphosphocytidyl-2-C-methyl-D-erythritol kinase
VIVETAYAKINLSLSVGHRRSDGYHEIDTIMHGISLTDTVELEPAEEGISLVITEGNAPEERENLMWKAAELFFAETGIETGVVMRLYKHIPSGAGMGGGSADAAAVLRGLNRMTKAGLSLSRLAEMGAKLGADIPFCVAGGCCRCQGIGEKLKRLMPWRGLPLVIVRPKILISTKKAYETIDGLVHHPKNTTDLLMKAIHYRDWSLLIHNLSNDFETGLFGSEPMLEKASSYLRRFSLPTLMTGSGSAFFVMTKTKEHQKELAAIIQKAHPDWFVAAAETV